MPAPHLEADVDPDLPVSGELRRPIDNREDPRFGGARQAGLNVAWLGWRGNLWGHLGNKEGPANTSHPFAHP